MCMFCLESSELTRNWEARKRCAATILRLEKAHILDTKAKYQLAKERGRMAGLERARFELVTYTSTLYQLQANGADMENIPSFASLMYRVSQPAL
jgi:hypothetical protein